MPSPTEDTANLFKRADYNEDYWDNYLTARPHYDERFYQAIYDYHRSHSDSFEIAHDIGTGPGQVAAELATHFDHIIASDVNPTHLAVAKHRLAPLISSQKITFEQCSAEDIANTSPPGSADLVVAAECLPLMDAASALHAFSRVLKPAGTLAIWFYGRPFFAEPEHEGACQPLLEAILDASFAKFIKGGGPRHREGWKRATDRMASFLDDVTLDEEVWGDVERRKWNKDHAMPFYGAGACDFEIEPTSAVGAKEKVAEVRDRAFWEKRWDLAGVRRFVSVNLPAFDESIRDESIEGMYRELGEAMGGHAAVRKITWPVVLILASRK